MKLKQLFIIDRTRLQLIIVMAFQLYYPTIGAPRRRPWMFLDDDDDSFFFNPFISNRSLEIVADELLRNSRQQQSKQNQKKSEDTNKDSEVVKQDDQSLAINLDLSGFKPANIRVKTVGRRLVVEGNQEDQTNEGGLRSYSRKQFHRSIMLPNNVNPDHVVSTLTNKGVLRITAPVMSLPPADEVKEIEVRREEGSEQEQTESSSKSVESSETKSAE